MYEEFLDKFCSKHGMSKEKALEQAIVKEFMDEKERLDREMSEMRPKDEGDGL